MQDNAPRPRVAPQLFDLTAQPPRGQPPPPLKFVDGKVINLATGEPITIKAVNWCVGFAPAVRKAKIHSLE
jgi:hypothetical protein